MARNKVEITTEDGKVCLNCLAPLQNMTYRLSMLGWSNLDIAKWLVNRYDFKLIDWLEEGVDMEDYHTLKRVQSWVSKMNRQKEEAMRAYTLDVLNQNMRYLASIAEGAMESNENDIAISAIDKMNRMAGGYKDNVSLSGESFTIKLAHHD